MLQNSICGGVMLKVGAPHSALPWSPLGPEQEASLLTFPPPIANSRPPPTTPSPVFLKFGHMYLSRLTNGVLALELGNSKVPSPPIAYSRPPPSRYTKFNQSNFLHLTNTVCQIHFRIREIPMKCPPIANCRPPTRPTSPPSPALNMTPHPPGDIFCQMNCWSILREDLI